MSRTIFHWIIGLQRIKITRILKIRNHIINLQMLLGNVNIPIIAVHAPIKMLINIFDIVFLLS